MVIRMKKLSLIIAAFLVVSLLSACGTQNKVDETTTETTEERTVQLNIKKDAMADPESFVDGMKVYGAEVQDSENADYYIFVLSQSEHEKLLKDKFDETVKTFKEYEDDPEHYIDSIEYDEGFRNLTINVNKELYGDGSNSSSNMVVAATALSYQLYLGNIQRTYVEVVFSGTDEVVSQFVLPMNLSVEQ